MYPQMDAPLDHLKKILDLLGPGIFLELDHAAFPRFFSGDIGRESAEVEASRFAKENKCFFSSDGHRAKFGRAYPKKYHD